MAGCVLTAVLGMGTVAWYALGEQFSDAEVEEMTHQRQDAKDERKTRRGRFYGVARLVGAGRARTRARAKARE
ncbi:hypothetical protein EW145_g6657 [Phellinidium pouzarii]|uniref:Uncharacterized protein n=1 Tax=Phellinidium pouzarii TaxID=167371 RepID=A0A4S4KVW8_9AGAM|nr:hypothetical protein EW145_g6657 [Phellinidium pouzarii]